MHYFTAQDIVTLDTAVAEKEERKHLVNAYVGLRSAGLDGYTYRLKWVNNKVGVEYPGIKWCWKRGVDLRDFCLNYDNVKDQSMVLNQLVKDKKGELATYFATRCTGVGDAEITYYDHEFKEEITSSTFIGAAERGYLEVVTALVGRGTDLNKCDSIGRTALYRATERSRVEVVRYLLGAAADMYINNRVGWSPFCRAAQMGNIEVVQAFLQAGVDAKIMNETH